MKKIKSIKVLSTLKIATPYIIFFLISLIVCQSTFKDSVSYRSDNKFHMTRFYGFVEGLKDGQVVPQYIPSFNDNFGYAPNLFYGPLPSFVSSIFYTITNNWVITESILLIMISFIGMCGMYFFVKEITSRKLTSTIGAILYGLSPYFVCNLVVRFAIGEAIGMMMLPYLFLGVYLWINNKSTKKSILLLTISMAIILLSHVGSIVIIAPFIVLFLILNYKKIFQKKLLKKKFLILLAACCTALAMSAVFILPMIESKILGNYSIFDNVFSYKFQFMGMDHLSSSTITLNDLIFGTRQTLHNDVPYAYLGVALSFLPVFVLLTKNVKYKKLVRNFSLILLFSIFLIVADPWRFLPSTFTLPIQFSWRFLSIASFSAAFISAIVIDSLVSKISLFSLNNKIKMILLGFIGCSIAILCLWVVKPAILVDSNRINGSYDKFPPDIMYCTNQCEYLPFNSMIKSAGSIEKVYDTINNNPYDANKLQTDARNKKGKSVDIISGDFNAQAIISQEKGSHATISIDKTSSLTQIELPKYYYPGWKAYILNGDGTKKTVSTGTSQYGFLTINIPKSEGPLEIYIYYGTSFATNLGIIISLCSCIVLVLYCIEKTTLRKRFDSFIEN